MLGLLFGGCFVSLLVVWGCAPSVEHLRADIRNQAFDRAVTNVSGDAAMERELAVLVIEDAASRGISSAELVDVLAGAGKSGKRALKRLVQTRDTTIGELASIALQRNDTPDAPDLVRWIHHDHSDVRAACAKAWYGQLDLQLLPRLILDHSPRVRVYAVRGVGRQRRSEEVGVILGEVLRLDPSPKVRAEAARLGALLGDDALILLKDALKDPNLGVRLGAVTGLSDIGTDAALVILEDWAAMSMSETTLAAAAELARRGVSLGRRRLTAALSNDTPDIRKAALLRLERARVETRRKILIQHLDDDSQEVVLLAAHLLRGDRAARPKVLKALGGVAESGSALSVVARDTLASLGDDKAVKAVEESLLTDEQADVVKTIARVRGVAALRAVFVSLLADPREPVRIEAARALIDIPL